MTISSKTILVVDDQIDNFDTLESLLIEEKLRLVYASSGPKALALLENVKPDLILLDVMMPEMDGIEVCRRLKKDNRYQNIPILIVTALNTKEDLSRCLEEGADDFIGKPFDRVELRARVNSLLRIKAQYDELENLIKLREEALTLREDMSNMLIHDLRNPLSSILLGANIAQQYLSHTHSMEKIAKKLAQINDAGKQMQKMIDSLLLMAKLESGKFLLNPTPTDLFALGTNIINDFELMAMIGQVELIGRLPPPEHHINIDATILRRIIDNLITNALKFSPPQSRVMLIMEYLPNEHLRIQVTDNGPGINDEQKLQVFEKFEIGEFQKNVPQIGLGLAFCKMAVEAQGGTLAIASNQPTGSIFIVEI